MEIEKLIARINELYHKSQAEGLSDEELKEQKALRAEYVANIRANLKSQLDNIDIVEKDGSIKQVNVLRSVCQALDEEAIRVVKSMPKWKAGENNGQKCRSFFQLPITFSLQ